MKRIVLIFLCVVTVASAVLCQAQMFVQTGVDVGRIVVINSDSSVVLDNQETYMPARVGMELNDLRVGDVVSIDYTKGAADSKVYFDVEGATKTSMPRALTQPHQSEQQHLK